MPESGEYVGVEVSAVGIDRSGLMGVMVLTSTDNRRFPMTGFSREVAEFIERFRRGDRISVPTVYKMIEELAEAYSLFLREVEVYGMDRVLRANLYFEGRERTLVLRHYRASDAIALAVYYNASIKLEKTLLDKTTSI